MRARGNMAQCVVDIAKTNQHQLAACRNGGKSTFEEGGGGLFDLWNTWGGRIVCSNHGFAEKQK